MGPLKPTDNSGLTARRLIASLQGCVLRPLCRQSAEATVIDKTTDERFCRSPWV
jgi:hypothetical protein